MKLTDSSMSVDCRCGANINSDTKMRLHKKVCTLATTSCYKSIISTLKSCSQHDYKSPIDFEKQHHKSLKSGGSSISEKGGVLTIKKLGSV